jgi:hypothetical protein
LPKNASRCIRASKGSAKETILDILGRLLDDALRLETINGYSSPGDFQETRERLSSFFAKK